MNVIRIRSISDPRLDIYRSLKKTNRTRHTDLFVVEGATVVRRLLASSYRLHSLLVTEARLEEFTNELPANVDVFVTDRSLASELVGFKFHVGVLAAAHRRQPPTLQSVLPADGDSLVLAGDRIIDQENVGALIRIAAAFGAHAVLLGRGSADGFSRRVMRVSMGNGLFFPVIENLDLETELPILTDAGYDTCATILHPDAEALAESRLQSRTVFVFGNETDGICPPVLDVCRRQITIPMFNGTDSVNVSIAAGIFGYAYRCRYPNAAAVS